MMRPTSDVAVYLCRDVVDMRKSINGLSILVEQAMELDLFSASLFVFCNRKRDKLKLLYWERTGFVLWYKRLEKDRFPWPRTADALVVSLTGREPEMGRFRHYSKSTLPNAYYRTLPKTQFILPIN